jgi:integrase
MQIKAHYREGRAKPWEARWWVNRRMRTRFFATEKERNRFIRDFQKEIGQHGDEIFKFDKDRMRRWQEADFLVPDVDPVALAEFWMKHHTAGPQRTVAEAMEAHLREMECAGRDPAYRKHARKAVERFAARFGERPVNTIIAEDVSDFLHDLPFEPLSKRHYRTYLVTAYKWFIRQRWATENPAAAVPTPKVLTPEPGILTVEETERLFRANEDVDPEICALLALGAFAGMRSSAVVRLSRDEIDFKNRAILTPAEKTKKGRRHFIEGLPDNLWPWLERVPAIAFEMSPRQYAFRRQKAFERAGLLISKEQAKKAGTPPKTPPKNCLRHSFVSYHVALHRDPGRTALLVSHKDQAILWEHDLGVATKADGERYFQIIPPF